jgi:hypothetical protein
MSDIITRYVASRDTIPNNVLILEINKLFPFYNSEMGLGEFGFSYSLFKNDDKLPQTIFELIIISSNYTYHPIDLFYKKDFESIFNEKFINYLNNENENENENKKNYFYQDLENENKKNIEFNNRMKKYMEETKNLGIYKDIDHEQDDWLENEMELFEIKKNMPLSELIKEIDINDNNYYSDENDEEY